ncbi:hypothetical protein JDV02_000297 [Purpureocillium takamizusanense]|uniref:Secreted protein n=1 Tax=Purpureocillium takamizusanense TaxID=2060973 RepID=A0A9Q8V6Q2_9HYPO|nr:uncharacterized protein JDV02_000297 [Purpureocillium takamizusanense]UNI13566.1 hypothetical protein JDV02_000297 [Purpureocillium takamizusanense]
MAFFFFVSPLFSALSREPYFVIGGLMATKRRKAHLTHTHSVFSYSEQAGRQVGKPVIHSRDGWRRDYRRRRRRRSRVLAASLDTRGPPDVLLQHRAAGNMGAARLVGGGGGGGGERQQKRVCERETPPPP